jgi:hypothetical protein
MQCVDIKELRFALIHIGYSVGILLIRYEP